MLETAAYSQILLADQPGALDTIKQATRATTRYGWDAEIVTRLVSLSRSLNEHGLGAVERDVDALVKQTAAALGVIRG